MLGEGLSNCSLCAFCFVRLSVLRDVGEHGERHEKYSRDWKTGPLFVVTDGNPIHIFAGTRQLLRDLQGTIHHAAHELLLQSASHIFGGARYLAQRSALQQCACSLLQHGSCQRDKFFFGNVGLLCAAQLGRAICIACSVAKIGEQSAGIVRCALLLCRDSRKACAAAFAFEEGCYFFCIPGW